MSILDEAIHLLNADRNSQLLYTIEIAP